MNTKIGIIGAGNMGTCLVGGLIRQGQPLTHLWVADHHEKNCQKLRESYAVFTTTQVVDIISKVEILVLAVKPQSMQELLQNIAAYLDRHDTLLISIAAGITTTQIQRWVGVSSFATVRAMPNIPALYGQGITGLYATEKVSPEQKEQAQQLFQAVGEICWIPDESLMDIVTALSGSGPAYFFYIMEGLIKAAVEMGLPEKIANELTIHTAIGSAKMALESKEDLGVLRKKVTSKGGTTEEGINALKSGKLEDLLASALARAFARGKILSENYD